MRFHPDGPLFVGDLISMEVIAPKGLNLGKQKVRVTADDPQDSLVGSADFGPFGIGGRYQATLFWGWNTSGLTAGEHTLTFSIGQPVVGVSLAISLPPGGLTWSETVTLLPAEGLPPPEPQAHWTMTETDCCLIYTITGTAAERDLPAIETTANSQAQDAARRLNINFDKAIPIILVPRVLGQGGFANDEISVSYLDRNYAGGEIAPVLHHEMIHILDARLGGELRPTLFVEGLAVYLTGGHFKPEPLMPRAAALLEMGGYLPLASLADSFYPAQHEAAYLEAASLIQYMVKTWGWQAFSDFYRDIHPDPNRSQAKAIDTALQKHFHLTFADLEDQFKAALGAIPVTPALRDDLRLTMSYYDTVRRYQQVLDPSAYFMTAWLPDGKLMRERGIVADFLRHPSSPENLALETMLVAADEHLRAGDYPLTGDLLKGVNSVLDAQEKASLDPFSASPLAGEYLGVVQALVAGGYQPQRIEVDQDAAQAWVTITGPELQELNLLKRDNQWGIGNH